METIICGYCRKKIISTTHNKKFCGVQSQKGSCADLAARERVENNRQAKVKRNYKEERTYSCDDEARDSGYF